MGLSDEVIFSLLHIPTQIGIWSYGAQVSQPIFTGGALQEICISPSHNTNRPSSRTSRQSSEHSATFPDALIGYAKLSLSSEFTNEHVADLQESVRLSILRYEGGTTTYLEVLDSQRSLLRRTLARECTGRRVSRLGSTLQSAGRRLAIVNISGQSRESTAVILKQSNLSKPFLVERAR